MFKSILKYLWVGSKPDDFISYPYTRGIKDAYYDWSNLRATGRFALGFVPIIRNVFFKQLVSERIVEDPFVLTNIDLKKGSTLLDFGCATSVLSLQLAALGYKITGVDLYPYPFKHPNFSFLQGDLLSHKLKSASFDCIYAVSSLEHVGLSYYPSEPESVSIEKEIDEITRLLKPGGTLLVTVPVGKPKTFKSLRVFDEVTISKLFSKYKITKKEYYIRVDDKVWQNTTYEKALNNFVNYKIGYTHSAIGCYKMIKK